MTAPKPALAEHGYWISTPRATFGVWATDGVVTFAAPIAYKQVMGRPVDDVLREYRSRGADVRPLPTPALTFTGIPLAYWRGEVALGCAVALARLRAIVESRGCDYEQTVEGLKDAD